MALWIIAALALLGIFYFPTWLAICAWIVLVGALAILFLDWEEEREP